MNSSLSYQPLLSLPSSRVTVTRLEVCILLTTPLSMSVLRNTTVTDWGRVRRLEMNLSHATAVMDTNHNTTVLSLVMASVPSKPLSPRLTSASRTCTGCVSDNSTVSIRPATIIPYSGKLCEARYDTHQEVNVIFVMFVADI